MIRRSTIAIVSVFLPIAAGVVAGAVDRVPNIGPRTAELVVGEYTCFSVIAPGEPFFLRKTMSFHGTSGVLGQELVFNRGVQLEEDPHQVCRTLTRRTVARAAEAGCTAGDPVAFPVNEIQSTLTTTFVCAGTRDAVVRAMAVLSGDFATAVP